MDISGHLENKLMAWIKLICIIQIYYYQNIIIKHDSTRARSESQLTRFLFCVTSLSFFLTPGWFDAVRCKEELLFPHCFLTSVFIFCLYLFCYNYRPKQNDTLIVTFNFFPLFGDLLIPNPLACSLHHHHQAENMNTKLLLLRWM